MLTYDDVDVPTGRLADGLRAEQLERFKGESWLSDLLSASVQPTTGAA